MLAVIFEDTLQLHKMNFMFYGTYSTSTFYINDISTYSVCSTDCPPITVIGYLFRAKEKSYLLCFPFICNITNSFSIPQCISVIQLYATINNSRNKSRGLLF